MPIFYFHCETCDSLFVGGESHIPCNTVCVMGRCDINKISEEEANRIVEEKRNE